MAKGIGEQKYVLFGTSIEINNDVYQFGGHVFYSFIFL